MDMSDGVRFDYLLLLEFIILASVSYQSTRFHFKELAAIGYQQSSSILYIENIGLICH